MLDGETYRVSLSEGEADAALSRDGFPAPGGGAGRSASDGSNRSVAGSEGEEAGREAR